MAAPSSLYCPTVSRAFKQEILQPLNILTFMDLNGVVTLTSILGSIQKDFNSLKVGSVVRTHFKIFFSAVNFCDLA